MQLMRTLLCPLILCVAISSAQGCASHGAIVTVEASTAPTDEAIKAEVRQMLTDSAAAWSAGDLERFMQDYAEDCLFLSPGMVTEGRAAVYERYKVRYPSTAAMGNLKLELLELRVLGPRATSVALRWHLQPAGGAEALNGLSVVVVTRGDDARWRIVHDISM